MERGASSLATRSDKNFRMRRRGWASSWSMSRSAEGKTSTAYAITLHHRLKRNGKLLSVLDALERTLRQIQILEIGEMLQDGFADVVCFRSSRALGELF